MPIDVPDSPKIYTTKYDNFRGVDYTNDASNVWRHRSPDGLNMLPRLDGNPFKRNGWKIEFTAQDFIVASGLVGITSVEQYKVDYFEIGGKEFLWFYTSIGCFYYADALTFVDTAYEIGDDKPYDFSKSNTYAVGDYCMSGGTMYKCKSAISTPTSTLPPNDTTHWTPTEEQDGETVPVDGSKPFSPSGGVDYTKSFFFEGGGRAGYYLFASDKMFMFDGARLHECKPTIPTVLTMADKNGVGTLLYEVNMLTEWRAIEYEIVNNTDREFKIPDGFINDTTSGGGVGGILNAYTINADGTLTPKYDWSIENQGALKFDTVPQNTRPNQTSLRIVYKSANSTVSSEEITSGEKNIKITKTVVTTTKQTRTFTVVKRAVKKNGKTTYVNEKKYSAWKDVDAAASILSAKITYANTATAAFPISNPQKPIVIQRYAKNGTWGGNDTSAIAASVNSYGTSVTISGTNNGKTLFDKCGSISSAKTTTTQYTNVKELSRTRVVTDKYVKTIPVKIKYTQWKYTAGQVASSEGRNAFFGTSRVLVFGNGIINQAFLTASSAEKYSSRVWYSMATDPLYFPDTNYIEVGATDKKIMGLMRVGDYLGIIKQGGSTDTSIYLAYATSFEDITTYAVKQSVNGIGAISNGAFNILNDEPLFLSSEGVMGIEPAEDDSRKLRNRSYYINKPLLEEPSLESAVSFVFDGMYWLCVNNRCYVLDGSQKSSWENAKTNLQYEAYYLDNIPAKCFAKKDGRLWFIDGLGNVCRFRDDNDDLQYVDAYDVEALSDPDLVLIKSNVAPTEGTYSFMDLTERTFIYQWDKMSVAEYHDYQSQGYTSDLSSHNPIEIRDVSIVFSTRHGRQGEELPYTFTSGVVSIAGSSLMNEPDYTTQIEIRINYVAGQTPNIGVGNVIQYGNVVYTVSEVDEDNETATVVEGCPIHARWSTIADDDGSAHYYKKLQKKGSVVALMPMSDSGVKVWLIPDGKPKEEWIFVGETDAKQTTLPFNYYLKKKVKKYKHLQIICENSSYNDGFGIDEIIKSYTVGNYAKK